ncbi:uncharacterized protein [Rutidosis leptorrhynchoides]|uniref:uncharacterized protein n=1 Tax=Rutidosis leptorrhynchoides TaxID=125765 RepID=UPI003A990DF2
MHKVGDGNRTLAWYDTWTDYGPLSDYITHRDIAREGYKKDTKVAELVNSDGWHWPHAWIQKFPMLMNIRPPDFARNDLICWRQYDGKLVDFSTKEAWESLRPRAPKVEWYYLVWFPQCIPCHSFIVWLMMGEHLKTQDKMRSWDIPVSQNVTLLCALCGIQPDTHDHLFFKCPYANQVWKKV